MNPPGGPRPLPGARNGAERQTGAGKRTSAMRATPRDRQQASGPARRTTSHCPRHRGIARQAGGRVRIA